MVTRCAVCGMPIIGNDNVSVIRHVTTIDGRGGWIALHVRCAAKPIPSAAARARMMPPGKPMEIPSLEIEPLESLEIPSLPSLTLEGV